MSCQSRITFTDYFGKFHLLKPSEITKIELETANIGVQWTFTTKGSVFMTKYFSSMDVANDWFNREVGPKIDASEKPDLQQEFEDIIKMKQEFEEWFQKTKQEYEESMRFLSPLPQGPYSE